MLFTFVCLLLFIMAAVLLRQVNMTQKAARGSDEWKLLYEQAHSDRVAALQKCQELERQNKILESRLGTCTPKHATSAASKPANAERAASDTAQPKIKKAPKTSETLTLILPIQLLSKNVRDRMHWRKQRQLKTDYLDIIRIKYRQPVTPQVKQKATVTRIKGASERDFDQQNIGAGSAIELIDALTAAGYWVDDSPTWLETEFRQGKSETVKGPAVKVEIQMLP